MDSGAAVTHHQGCIITPYNRYITISSQLKNQTYLNKKDKESPVANLIKPQRS